MAVGNPLATAWEESTKLLCQARSHLRLENSSGCRGAIAHSIGALAFFAHALRKEHRHLSMSPDRAYSDKRWSILDQFFSESLRADPFALAKVRRLLDLVADSSWPKDSLPVTRTDAVVVVEATESLLTIGALIIGLDGMENAS